jgi:aminoglycoside 3-N-acetyltransferase
VTAPGRLLNDPDFVPVTCSELASALTTLGVGHGDTLMVHVRLSALRWVVGGIDTVIYALRDAVGDAGTIMALCGWEDSPYHLDLWPRTWQDAYEELPPFDPLVSSARRDFGRFPERLRTWPDAIRRNHPEASFVALGPKARWLTDEPGDGDPWGRDGPPGRLARVHGRVLLLGAPLKTMALCHHAEAIARVTGKRYRDYRMRHQDSLGHDLA